MSNDNIVQLRGAKPADVVAAPKGEPNAALVKMLEHLMELALSGRLAGIAFTTMDPEGSIITAWSSDTRMSMAGAISVLQHRYIQELLGNA